MITGVLRYLAAGVLAFLVDFGLLALFREVLGWPTAIAAAVAFLMSFAFTYTIQRTLGFMSGAPHGRALIRYTILVALNTVATAVIVASLDQTPAGWGVGKVLATASTTIWNYFAYRWWVFAEDATEQSATDQES